MASHFLRIAASAAARDAQTAAGSRASYARMEAKGEGADRLGAAEAAFIAARDSFYIASVNPDGWPYIQHRGGPAGFLRVLDAQRLGFADFAGNRQYLTLGNVDTDDRVALFLMDYPNRRRLKLLGRMHVADEATVAALAEPGYRARVERGFVIEVAAFDWNCPQHITPRFTEAELAPALAPISQKLDALDRENIALRARIAELEQEKRP
ncbi:MULTISPECIES: pyridoxamine 5'-phosphate oxidase family protein [unclassified Sphingomonas]|jgi:predicted pyridoxine 5'-phosphate oxidase superfamily flavin-nucleotide-binding protein|uniref:pyridoxamine 5'-phosphate oxidase family protein n=1 Tax=unclassified Sphingomonas TaxID=196159 RepID=UPI0008354EA6|nr:MULTISPECIES: pyridoxamine 5'-phosphate oxidase family protein [unclassified Sphingomonas]MCH4893208.1 pyridoxamine 5'-phosphate oxidase family protein [Sphingomonas sp. SFZ2018-12]